MRRIDLLKRVGVSLLIVIVVIAGASLGSVVYGEDRGQDNLEPLKNTEFDPQSSNLDPLESEGTLRPNVDPNRSGTVVIDLAHNNNLDRADISPLIRGLTLANQTVRFLQSEGNLSDQLDNANAFVVITPGSEYDPNAVNTVRNFVDNGGHLLLIGEPNRIRADGFFIIRKSDEIRELAAAHGISFDTRYLYNLETNDGNYKHVIAHPPDTESMNISENSTLAHIERTTIYTGTQVTARNGSPLLVATENTQLSDGGARGKHTVAVKREGVIAIGDRSFIQSDRYSIADNEKFLSYLIRFLADGQKS